MPCHLVHNLLTISFQNKNRTKQKEEEYNPGGACVQWPSATGHIAMQTHVQDWKRVRRLTGPVAAGHWTQAGPIQSILLSIDRSENHLHFKILSRSP